MKWQRLVPTFLMVMLLGVTGFALPDSPIVHMRVTLPDGHTQAVASPESGMATLTLEDGVEFGFRPTIQDSKPWTRVDVTIFATPTATHASEELGEVELKTGGPAMSSKTTPQFKVAVTSVSAPTS